MTTITADAGLERILAAQAAALKALQSAAGGDSLCTLRRERVAAAKYHEGAVAALGAAARAVRRGDPLPDPDAWDPIAVARAGGDSRWHAYLLGGRDALIALG